MTNATQNKEITMTKLINDYHSTFCFTHKTRREIDEIIETHPAQRTKNQRIWVRYVWRKLCGVNNCTCGNDIGERSDTCNPTTPNTTEYLEEEEGILAAMRAKNFSVLHPDTTLEDVTAADSVPITDLRVTLMAN